MSLDFHKISTRLTQREQDYLSSLNERYQTGTVTEFVHRFLDDCIKCNVGIITKTTDNEKKKNNKHNNNSNMAYKKSSNNSSSNRDPFAKDDEDYFEEDTVNEFNSDFEEEEEEEEDQPFSSSFGYSQNNRTHDKNFNKYRNNNNKKDKDRTVSLSIPIVDDMITRLADAERNQTSYQNLLEQYRAYIQHLHRVIEQPPQIKKKKTIGTHMMKDFNFPNSNSWFPYATPQPTISDANYCNASIPYIFPVHSTSTPQQPEEEEKKRRRFDCFDIFTNDIEKAMKFKNALDGFYGNNNNNKYRK